MPRPHQDSHNGQGGRREVPFGPEISWPHGFRQIDPQSRDAFEAAYGPGPAHTGPAYQQPAMDDYDGYGDPGYSDPSYDGPRTSYAGPAFPGGNGDPRNAGGPRGSGGPGYQTPGSRVPGYQVPEVRDNSRSDTSRSGHSSPGYEAPGHSSPGYDTGGYGTSGYEAGGYGTGGYEAPGYAAPGYAGSGYQPAPPAARDDIYPVTGAMEALPETGPQPLAPWGDRDGFGKTGTSAYPEQWYDHPRLDDRARDVLPAADPRPADPRPGDPRLEGIRYDELRYDEPASGGTGLDEPLDDDSWYEELRRSAPAYPQTPGDRHPSGPVRQVPSSGQQPGYSPPPATERFGYGQQPRGGSGPQTDRGGSGPQLSAPQLGTGRPRAGGPAEMNTARPTFTPNPGAGFLGAPPAAHVGVLTPPAGSRIDTSRIETGRIETGRTEMGRTETLPESRPSLASQGTRQFPAAPPAAPPAGSAAAPARQAAPKVRPGHGLDGPMITSSWPAQPATGDVESFEDFWADDDDEAEYKGLFGDRDTSQDGPARRRVPMGRANKAGLDAAKRIGRRRGGSNDHRLWIGLGVVVVLAAAAIVGIIKFEFPSHSGPAHTMQTPATIGTYARTVDLEKEANLSQLRNEVIKMSAGQATDVKSGMYESGKAAAGNTEQIIMFIGGHLANADPASSIAGFKQKYPGATLVNPGSLGGEATCVEEGGGTSESVSMCAWFDNDSFGEIVSPTMNASALAKAMLTVRPAVELVVKK